MPKLEIQVKGLSKVVGYYHSRPQVVKRELQGALTKSAFIVQRNARQEAPVDTSNLRGGIAINPLGQMGVSIGPRAKYAIFVHEGTRPHFPPLRAITPWARKRGIEPYLVALGISRKGTKANRFMVRAANNSRRPVQATFDEALKNIARAS